MHRLISICHDRLAKLDMGIYKSQLCSSSGNIVVPNNRFMSVCNDHHRVSEADEHTRCSRDGLDTNQHITIGKSIVHVAIKAFTVQLFESSPSHFWKSRQVLGIMLARLDTK